MLPPFAAAETVTFVDDPTEFVVTGKVALALPAGTVTDCGIDATADAPPVTVNVTTVLWVKGDGKLTFPVVLFPPVTVVGENESADGVIAVTVNEPLLDKPFKVAETVTLTGDDTWAVCIVQVAVVAPMGTTTEDGIPEIAEAPLTIASATPVSSAAGALIVTVAVVGIPPRTPLPTTLTGCGGVSVKAAGAL